MIDEKTCKVCKRTKSKRNDFHNRRAARDGKCPICIECWNRLYVAPKKSKAA